MSTPSKVQLDHRYQLDNRVAAGGYGEVWRATDLVLGRSVAVKLLLAQHVQQAQTLARFRAEAQRAGALTHQNIARVYDYVEPRPPQPPFLVMELIDGPSLAQVLERGPLPPAQVMGILAGAASGLQAAHDAGLVHRDIKPANLLLTRDGTVKITDFGISYAADSAPMTASGMLLGTAGYMAPERLGGGPVTGAADLYALGIVGFECLAGDSPFGGTPLEIAVAHRDRPLPPLPSSVPPGVAALIGALTAKDPAARPATAGEVARAAAGQHDWLAGGATQAEHSSPPGGTRTAPYQQPTSAYGDQAATMAAPPGPVTPAYQPTSRYDSGGPYATQGGYAPAGPTGPPGSYDPYDDPYGPGGRGRHGGGPGDGRGRRRTVLFAAVAAIVIIAAVAIGLVLTQSGGSSGPSVKSSTGPSATSAATAGGGGAGQPTTGSQASAPAATTPAQQAPTTPPAARTTPAAPRTTPAAPATTAPAAPTASAAAATAAPATPGNGNANGNGQTNGNANGHGNGNG
ncbi:MAG TPA: protein kinase [Streptosporangiaceae bacterium]